MKTLLDFTKHKTLKKTFVEWSKESKKQKDDKFWMEYYLNTNARIYIKPIDTSFGALERPFF